MVSSVCDGKQLRSTKTIVYKSTKMVSSMVVGSVMVWGCMSAAGTGELQFIEGTTNANMSEAEHDPLPSETGPQGSKFTLLYKLYTHYFTL